MRPQHQRSHSTPYDDSGRVVRRFNRHCDASNLGRLHLREIHEWSGDQGERSWLAFDQSAGSSWGSRANGGRRVPGRRRLKHWARWLRDAEYVRAWVYLGKPLRPIALIHERAVAAANGRTVDPRFVKIQAAQAGIAGRVANKHTAQGTVHIPSSAWSRRPARTPVANDTVEVSATESGDQPGWRSCPQCAGDRRTL